MRLVLSASLPPSGAARRTRTFGAKADIEIALRNVGYNPKRQHDINPSTELETLFEATQKQAENLMTSAERVCKGRAGEAIEVLLLAAACLYRAKHKGGDCTDFVELQADCLAGVWANRAQEKWKFIEPGDVEAAMQTASAIGDDRLQRQSQGYVVPDAFTHGSSEQRTHWFMTGLKSGNVASCDTFRAEQL